MKKLLSLFMALAALAFVAIPVYAAVNAVTPSTNDINRINGWAHVNQLEKNVGSAKLEFVSTRGFNSCFEYRTDGDTSQASGANYNTLVTDGLYPFVCVNNSTKTKDIFASEYIEVRMVFGAEGDERFDWTRFDVKTLPTTPTVTGFHSPELNCGAITNAKMVTVDWSDSTVVGGTITGYEYWINYPKTDGTRGDWKPFFTTSQYRGSLNEGLHIVKVRAKDNFGNYSEWSNECSITADWTAPDVEITTPIDGFTVSGIVEIKGSVTDINPHHYWFVIENSSGVTVAGPGVVNDTTSFTDKLLLSWDTTFIPEGNYTVKLEARDAADNKDTGSVDWHTVTVKNTPTLKDDCKNNGWKTFYKPIFKNQGDCVSWIQSNPNAKGNKKDN